MSKYPRYRKLNGSEMIRCHDNYFISENWLSVEFQDSEMQKIMHQIKTFIYTNPLFQREHGAFHPNTNSPISWFGTCVTLPFTKRLLLCPTITAFAHNSGKEDYWRHKNQISPFYNPNNGFEKSCFIEQNGNAHKHLAQKIIPTII